MRLIDADALLEVLGDPHMMVMLSKTKAEDTGEWGLLCRRMDVLRRVLSAPTIDAAPVVHARWEKNIYNGRTRCSFCKMSLPVVWYYNDEDQDDNCEEIDATPFCPNCGAKMDGGADNE